MEMPFDGTITEALRMGRETMGRLRVTDVLLLSVAALLVQVSIHGILIDCHI
jgi:hypothetical protein